MYGDINTADFASRAILTLQNYSVAEINDKISLKFSQHFWEYKSADCVEVNNPRYHVWPVGSLRILAPNGPPSPQNCHYTLVYL